MQHVSVFDKEYHLDIMVDFTNEGKVCPYVVADGKIAKRVTGYYSIYGDLKEAKAMLSYIEGNPTIPIIVKGSMFKAFIAQYAKCFTNAWVRGVKLEPDNVFKNNEELLKAHDGLMEIRNNYIAHAGEGHYQFGGMVVYLNPDQKNPLIRRILFSELRLMDLSIKIPDYNNLCQHLLDFVRNKLEDIRPHFNKELDSNDLVGMYKRSKMPDPNDFKMSSHAEHLNVKGSSEKDVRS
jgi:hypothetical protein